MIVFKISTLVIILRSVRGEFLDLPEGSPCKWMNATELVKENMMVQGTCVGVRRCYSFSYDTEKKNVPPTCTFKGKEPIICCTDCGFLSEESSIKDPLDHEYYKTDRKYKRKCFEYQYLLPYSCKTHKNRKLTRFLNEKNKCWDYLLTTWAAVGGQDARRGDFPHMALLGYGPDPDSAEWLCGGSLISERFILTAGHCASSAQLGPVTYVALGLLKRTDPAHYWKRYKVNRFIPHPEYKPPLKYHDIALIETDITMNFTEGVRPACLTHKPEFKGDELAYATGWGSLGPSKENADVMQKVFLQKFTAEECEAQYPPHRHLPQGINHTTQICYGDHQEVRDTCEGDSGGPLQKRDSSSGYCPYAIIGVTSTGRECGKPGAAGIYTRVHHYVPWIESIVWPNLTWSNI